jgi:ABC-type multidrug transport system ATPase subunit
MRLTPFLALSHILSCDDIGTFDGDAIVYGLSIRQNADAVRKLVGLCKQDDYLWPNLSAKEHLELFAGLRGVASQDMFSIVQKWLKSVDLDTVANHFTSSFSGGMKRRLSVSLATIGASQKLIILDEPTTGK